MAKYSNKRSYAGWWMAGSAVIITVGLLLWGNYSASTKTNRELAMGCTSDSLTQFHIHPDLKIVINGAQREIPADIGISFACMHPIHTHDATGKIHIESPEARDFTLGDFFAVWGKAFNENQILDAMVDETHAIKVTVNGAAADTYEKTVMRDNDQIVVSYGARR